MTEKAIEAGLNQETRLISWLDGTSKAFTEFVFWWQAYDFLFVCGNYTHQKLIDLAKANQADVGGSFEDNLQSVVAYVYRIARKKARLD